MVLHRYLAEAESRRNVTVAEPFDERGEDFTFPRRQTKVVILDVETRAFEQHTQAAFDIAVGRGFHPETPSEHGMDGV